MKFLVDVNASGALTDWLNRQGHDVALVADEDPRMFDDDILQWANREQRVIITTDRDFEHKIWRERQQHQGVLRLENLPRAQRLALLADVLLHHSTALRDGAVVIASSKKIRIRKPFNG